MILKINLFLYILASNGAKIIILVSKHMFIGMRNRLMIFLRPSKQPFWHKMKMAAKILNFRFCDLVIIFLKMYSWSNGITSYHGETTFFLSLNMSIIKNRRLTWNKLGRTFKFSHLLHDALNCIKGKRDSLEISFLHILASNDTKILIFVSKHMFIGMRDLFMILL